MHGAEDADHFFADLERDVEFAVGVFFASLLVRIFAHVWRVARAPDGGDVTDHGSVWWGDLIVTLSTDGPTRVPFCEPSVGVARSISYIARHLLKGRAAAVTSNGISNSATLRKPLIRRK